MRGRFGHASHILRMAALFLAGFVAFLIARAVLVPADFNTLGFYRAGAIDDVRARPIAYAGRSACEGCHAGIYWSTADDAKETAEANPKKDNRHSVLRCETCHGPLNAHRLEKEAKDKAEAAGKEFTGKEVPVPHVAGDKLCLGCHRQITGRPEMQPQIVPVDHGGQDKCESCHRPHRPRTDEDEE